MEKTKTDFQPFVRTLFYGKVASKSLFPFPQPKENQEELLTMTLDSLEKLGKEINVDSIEENKKVPQSVIKKMAEMGLFGLIIPEEYGGFGFSNLSYIQTLAALTLIDNSIAIILGAHQSLGLKALLMFGSDEQKRRFLPKLATGEYIAAFGLTEPEAGSDVRNIKTTAKLSEDKKSYIINGNKIWITNGGIGNFFTVFAKTPITENGETKDKITAFIVTRDMKGFSSGPEEKKMGLLGSSTTELAFDNVKVGVENVIGKPGEGFKIALSVLNNGRLGLAGACAFGSKKIIEKAYEHASERIQFGKKLIEFDMIKSKFARMLAENYAAESLVRYTAALMDMGVDDYSLETAICKVFSTEYVWRTVNECLQIAGGTGYMKEYGYEKVVRDSRVFTIWEGANEILRLFIGLSGLQGPGNSLKEISKVLKKPFEDFGRSIGILSDFGVKWIKKRVNLTDKLVGVHPVLEKEAEIFSQYVLKFGAMNESILFSYGKTIVEKECVIKRVSDIAIELFAIATSLSRLSYEINKFGEEKKAFEIMLVKLFVRQAKRRISENIRRQQKSDDKLEKNIVKSFIDNDGFKTRGYF